MGKMSNRRRRKRKKLKKLYKFMKSLLPIKPRLPTPPPGVIFKSKKDYDRKQNRKVINKALKEND